MFIHDLLADRQMMIRIEKLQSVLRTDLGVNFNVYRKRRVARHRRRKNTGSGGMGKTLREIERFGKNL